MSEQPITTRVDVLEQQMARQERNTQAIDALINVMDRIQQSMEERFTGIALLIERLPPQP